MERIIYFGEIATPLSLGIQYVDDIDPNTTDLEIFDYEANEGVFDEPETCCRTSCSDFSEINSDNADSTLVTVYSILNTLDITRSPSCIYNEIYNCVCVLCFCIINKLGSESLQLACADAYLRNRHEVLHKSAMVSLGLPSLDTDVRFSDFFPIDSDRTPDCIIKNDFDNSVLIIETTVSTDKGKSYQMKGKIDEGFQSKYNYEISQIKELGYTVNYFVLHFDSKDLYNSDYKQELENISQILSSSVRPEWVDKLEIIRRCCCNIHMQFSKFMSPLIGLLFVDSFSPNYYPNQLYKILSCDVKVDMPSYSRISISQNTYYRIQTSWPRLIRLLEVLEPDFYFLTLDLVTNKLNFTKNSRGLHFDVWNNILNINDKSAVFQNLKMVVGTVETTESFGKIEYFVKSSDLIITRDNTIFQLQLHDDTSKCSINNPVPDYSDFVSVNEFLTTGVKTERANIDDKLEELLTPLFNIDTEEEFLKKSNSLKKKPFCATLSGEAEFKKAISSFELDYNKINSLTDEPRNVLHQKASFLYPLINPNTGVYTSYKSKNGDFLDSLSNCNLGPFTQIILSKIMNTDFQMGGKPQPAPSEILKIEEELSSNQRELNRVQINSKKDGKIVKAREIPECVELLNKQKQIRQDLRVACKRLNYKKNLISLVRLPTRNKKGLNSLGHKFKQEMTHFKSKGENSVYKGVGRLNYNLLKNEFEVLKNHMLLPSKETCPDPLYDEFVSDDANLLKKLKEDTISNHKEFYDFLKNTSIYGTCAMICRLCYTLSYFSQTAVGGDYTFVDNLGHSKTLLFIKGGKKIFKTKRSKLFKLFFPTYTSAEVCYNRAGYNSNYKIHKVSNETIIETPWMMLDEQLLVDGLTFLSRNMGFVMVNKGLSFDNMGTLSMCYFNIVLSIHARRQTEEFLHNVRYLTVNCMSESSSISLMLPTLASFNNDFFQCFLKESIINNFLEVANFLKSMHDDLKKQSPDVYLNNVNMKHLFDPSILISNTDQLTLMIYCTFLMSKAPVNQGLEQLRNLKGMLETHLKFEKTCHNELNEQYEKDTVDVTKFDNAENYWNGLFNNDFVYDPGYVNQLGKFCGDYLSNFITSGEVSSKWESILSQPWDLFANTKGLRGKRGEKDFFGKKGYFVVYKEVLRDPNYLENVLSVITSEDDDHKKRKLLNKLNQDYKSKLNSFNLEFCVFHVVDKRQRGGSRGVVCMDLFTKIHQQPIEKLCGYFCKNIPNELISIPSNKRVFHVHSNVHERFRDTSGVVYNISFDCRKWAPHSVSTKFVDFILGMRSFLPRSFVVHILAFFEKMNKKRVYTKNYVKEMLDNTLSTSKDMKAILKQDDLVDAPYFVLPYSWMMGIFNYLSSLLHVANQLHISHVVNNLSVKNLTEEVNLHMTAHSDDSGGKLLCKDRLTMFKVMTVYELLLKASNHMLSDKKCNISLVYFELLSILYFGERLMSLMPKFAGSFNFHPSDGGYAVDIGEAYSKCTELLMVGATFEQAYIAFKIQSMLIWRFYFGKNIDKIYYSYPPQLLGMPDAHPINILISGTDADLIRLYLFCPNLPFIDYLKISKFFIGFDELSDSFITSLKASPRIIISKDLKEFSSMINCFNEKEENKGLTWLLNNVSIKNTGFQLLSFLGKLKDKKFVAALQDETIERRISRAFYYRNSQCLDTKSGPMSYKQFKEFLTLNYIIRNNMVAPQGQEWVDELTEIFSKLSEDDEVFEEGKKYFEILNSEIITLNKAMNTRLYDDEMVVVSQKTCKPIHVNIQRISAPLSTDYKPDMLTAWIKFPETRWILPFASYKQTEALLEDFLMTKGLKIADCEPNWLHKLLRKYKDKYLKEFYMYSNMPASSRDINNYKDVLLFLAHNSFKGKYINGIVSPYNRLMNVTFTQIFEDLIDSETSKAINLIDFLTGALNDFKMMAIISRCKINGSNIIGVNGIIELIENIVKSKEHHHYLNNLVYPHFQCLKVFVSGFRNINEWISNSYFHCFTKRQHLVGNVWVGKGKLYINTPSFKLLLEIENQKIATCLINNNNLIISKYDLAYIDYVLTIGQLSGLKNHLIPVETKNWAMMGLGINQQGDFCIGIQRFLVTTIPRVYLNKMPHPVLSNISVCGVKILPRLKYKINKETEFTNENLIIHTFDMPVDNIISTLNEVLQNEQNKLIAAELGKDFKDYIDYVVGTVSNSELYLSFTDFYDNYQISQLYYILYECRKRELVNFQKLKIRNRFYPAQEGGLLNLLIEFKNINPDFLFNTDLVLTPELAYLKATQPEAFLTNLTTNIKERYDSLYTSLDKSLILRKMKELVDNIGTDTFESKMVDFLSTWGYTGVMGSLGELKMEKTYETFSNIIFPADNLQTNIAKRQLIGFIDAFYKIFISSGVGDRLTDYEFENNLKVENFTKLFKSFLFSQCLNCYTKNYTYSCLNLTMPWVWFNNLLSACLQDNLFSSLFEVEISEIIGWYTIPVEFSSRHNWSQALQTLFNIVNESVVQKCKLNKSRQFYRLSSDTLNFKSIMQLYTSVPQLLEVRKLSYCGTLSTFLVNNLKTPKTVLHKDKSYRITTILREIGDKLIFYNRKFIFENQLSEDLLEMDEFEDLNYELMSNDPDLKIVEEVLEQVENIYVEENPTFCYLRIHGKYTKCENIELSLINLVGSSSSQHDLNKTRCVGKDLLIISDVLHKELVMSDSNIVSVFQIKQNNKSLAIINERHLIAYTITKYSRDIFSKAFDFVPLSKNLLSREYFTQCYSIYYAPGGLQLDLRKVITDEENLNILLIQAKGMKDRRNLPESKKVEDVEKIEVNLIEEYAQNNNLDVDIVKKYLKEVKITKTVYDFEAVKHAISKIKSDENKKFISQNIRNVIEKPHEAKTIEKIFEVPEVFQTGRSVVSDAKNRALKDPRIRAELESIAPNLTNLILSNRLTINKSKLKKIRTNQTLWKGYLSQTSLEKKNKKFLIDLITLITNDANISDDPSNDSIWDNIVDKVSDKIVDDEESETEDIAYDNAPNAGHLNYKPR